MASRISPATCEETPSFGSRYLLVEKLGAGGCGVVYKAVDTVLEKDVAVKIVVSGLDASLVIRFQQEAIATAKLDHHNIVKVRDFGSTSNGELYLVMDFINGKSLENLIKTDGPVDLIEALLIFVQICSGMQHAHSHNILHRDIKPSNIMLLPEPDGSRSVQIVDFGLAKMEDSSQRLTEAGMRLGSPLYMSPEQASGEEVDTRSDIYSLGCLMYKTLVGTPPLRGETYIETLRKQREEEPLPLNDNSVGLTFPARMQEIIAKTLAKYPGQRYQTMNELKEALLALLEELHVEAPVSQKIVEETPRQDRKRHDPLQYFLVPSIALLCIFAAVTIAFLIHTMQSRGERDEVTSPAVSGAKVSEVLTTKKVETGSGNERESQEIDPWSSPRESERHRDGQRGDRDGQRGGDEHRSSGGIRNEYRHSRGWDHGNRSGGREYGRFYRNDELRSLLDDPNFSSLSKDSISLWTEPSMREVWKDPVVYLFIANPKNFSDWRSEKISAKIRKYKENEHVVRLMGDERFQRFLKEPGSKQLLADLRFIQVIKDDTHWIVAFENLRERRNWSGSRRRDRTAGGGDSWYDPDLSSLWHDSRMQRIMGPMTEFRRDPAMKKALLDPLAQEFLIKKYWLDWDKVPVKPMLIKYKNNDNIKLIMGDQTFERMMAHPDFAVLVTDKRFPKFLAGFGYEDGGEHHESDHRDSGRPDDRETSNVEQEEIWQEMNERSLK